MVEWTDKRNRTILWLSPLCITIVCLVKPVMNIIVNQTLTVGDIMLLIVALCSLGLSIFAIWRTKRLQLSISKPKSQTTTDFPKEKIPALIIVAFGFFFIAVGVCIGVILGINNLFALILFGVGIVVFMWGIVKMGSNIEEKQ